VSRAAAGRQKSLLNSAGQQKNIEQSVAIVDSEQVQGKSILLVDDMVDSRWSLTVVAAKLLESGARSVYPYALVSTSGANS
jgi:ATP-dependent DNA helicase RecQ